MTQHTDSLTASAICDRIGRKTIADAIGVGLTQVSNAVSKGSFPARWYLVLRRLCDDAGISCPSGLFTFILPSSHAPEDTDPASAADLSFGAVCDHGPDNCGVPPQPHVANRPAAVCAAADNHARITAAAD